MQGEVLDIAPALVWVAAIAALLSFGTTIWGIISSPSKANARRIEDVSARLDGHDARLLRLEQALTAMPSKDDMHQVELALEGMKGELRAMVAKMEGTKDIMERLEAIVTRHEDHLLGAKR